MAEMKTPGGMEEVKEKMVATQEEIEGMSAEVLYEATKQEMTEFLKGKKSPEGVELEKGLIKQIEEFEKDFQEMCPAEHAQMVAEAAKQ